MNLEKIQRSDVDYKGKNKKGKKKRGFKKSTAFEYEQLLNELLFSVAIAAEGDARGLWCFNNGVIAQVPECVPANRWGFVMTPHLATLQPAGITHACGEPAIDKPQPCGLLGLQADFTLACAANDTRACIASGAGHGPLVSLLQACKGDNKDKVKMEYEKEGKKESKEISCQPVKDFMKSQLDAITAHCNPSGGDAVKAVMEVCRLAQTEITGILQKAETVTGPQVTEQTKKLLIIGDGHMLNDNYGGALHTCLSSARMNVKMVARERSIPSIWTSGDHSSIGEAATAVYSTGNANESCIANGEGEARTLACKKRPTLEDSEKKLETLLTNPQHQADTVVLAMGDALIKKEGETGTINEAEIKAQYETMIAPLKAAGKGCIIMTPTLPAGDKSIKTRALITKITAAIKDANKAASGGDERNLYCSVIDGADLMEAQKVQGKDHLPERPGGDGFQLTDENYKTYASRSCEEIQKAMQPRAAAAVVQPDAARDVQSIKK